ncbi:hypothetical protein P5P86_06400 [Nocardioides sp. BP30]|uniref:hypothetical protein n=1 Tax=Nocardioides sp. BP30 TaxID=3036374 RepID=UPI0024690505|nr:hypothetical protein [Nocardioides sp. BP30]WGL53458.1 hypothetical protein P5P86_06400 [Nocardioides sp. BP30]
MGPSPALRLLLGLALLLGGALVGLATVAVHAWWWGLLLAAVASIACVLALPARWWAQVSFTVGWWVPFAIAMFSRREGDYAVGRHPLDYGLVALGPVLELVALVRLVRDSARRGARGTPASRTSPAP